MSAVLLAVFKEYPHADRVRTRLVREGFPTDRVELTAAADPGRAGISPADTARTRFVQYFRMLLKEADEQPFVEQLAQRVEDGTATTVVVHPRGDIETKRASAILETEGAVEVVGHDLDRQSFEHAAARSEGYWVRHFMLDNPTGADCLYCRLFEDHRH
jgi:hypothetical protein